ncbi:Gfo/Idh/MocA family protein [Cytobacillus firmus]|uniref:Putative oxidoreductase YgjR n=1 Tax=Cytobacillus firmus TaxID=1399 RepID=A0A380XQK9_CYTFI|nr:Gfo/Idh/MocA family oxidoreductase [Cytobacillus firmus]KAF0825227.1 putative oxidoreductase YgjR [Cytobacillus firmus]MBG9542240.1 oxidoreductase [Cytobacillus firmus]MBG9547259.1 oxidoreductase [Cytobacillus firmus]MBG9553739.1 oxidoreductase [Cytobacillus firmus]MBG9556195.1 oxidoreductase [Cytobacillus firmus]
MVRFGIVGTNWITERFLKAALQAEDFQLTAVYSRTEEKAKKFAGNYGVERTFTDLQTMAASGEIDAVYIASPNSLHAEQAIIFMKHNVHVLCEKPIASNIKELQTMIAAARENNVLLMEALKSTFMPNFLAVKENLHKIGQVRRYFASYCQYSSRYDAYRQGTVLNAFNPEFSNGSIMDIGIYCIYPLVALFGKPEEIKAAGYKLESGVDGEGSIVLKYPDMDAVIMYSKITNSSLPAEIQGEEGNIVIDKISTPEKVELHYRNGEKEDLTQDQLSDSMYYEAKEFIRLVQAGKTESDINSFANSMITMEIIEEARRQIGVVYPADRN